MGLLAVVVLGGLAVLPARTWISQRQQTRDAQAEVERLDVEAAELGRQLELLETDAEMERRARRDFDLVYPGEESYRILPSEEP